jgi:hypothetical protein
MTNNRSIMMIVDDEDSVEGADVGPAKGGCAETMVDGASEYIIFIYYPIQKPY